MKQVLSVAAPPVAAVPAELTIRQARVGDIPTILELHRQAFADKFGGAFGSAATQIERGSLALASAWQARNGRALRGMLVAEVDQRVVGTATLRTWEMGDEDSQAIEAAFQQALGVWRAMRSMFVLSLLNHHIAQREGFITDVAVAEAFRRRGVASAILSRLEANARRMQKRYLGLYVSRANAGAIQLYEHLGFYQQHIRRSWLTHMAFGQRSWLYMRKDLG